MVSKIEAVDAYANRISEQAQTASSQGTKGLEIVQGLDDTSQQFNQLAKRLIINIGQVAEQSKQIISIINTIEEISNHTDLLALNATVESSRAGEAGRGFAVVAYEVRKLSEKTKDEANSIHHVIHSIHEQMDKLQEEAQQLDKFSETQNNAVQQTGHSFREIVEDINEIEQDIDQVDTSLTQVKHASQQLSSSMQDMSAISEQSTASSEEVSATSNNQLSAIEDVNQVAFHLQELAQKLENELNQFQLQANDDNDSDRKMVDTRSVME